MRPSGQFPRLCRRDGMGVVRHLVVAPGGRMSGKSLAQADRSAIDGPRLDDQRAVLGQLGGAAGRRPHDGDMAGLVVAMAFVRGAGMTWSRPGRPWSPLFGMFGKEVEVQEAWVVTSPGWNHRKAHAGN